MDIKKYIKNKDIELSNDDVDIERLEKDLLKGYELSSDVEKKISSAVDEAKKTSKTAYSELETKYNDLQTKYDEVEKRNVDIVEKNKSLALENVMTRAGFEEKDFKDISTIRTSMFGDIVDDTEAVSKIKEKYQNTYFPKPEVQPVKDDQPLKTGTSEPKEPIVTRKTSIKDLMK